MTLAAQVNTFIADMGRAQAATKKTGDAAADAAAKFQEQVGAMRQVGAGLTVMGAVATAATALAVKAAIDWETAWTGVTKTVDGTAEEMAALESELRGLATTLPATHQEIAAVAEAAGQLGVKRQDVAAFTKTMIDLSETTNLSADEAATSLAQLMNVMQTAPEDVDNLGAALVALGNDGASTERDIVMMAQRIAGAGRTVGLSEGEVLGFANALASVGIEAQAGGSAVSRIMTDIAKSVSTGGEELDRFAKVAGMSSKDFQKAFKDDPADAIATFVEGLGRIDAEGGDVFTTLEELGQSDIQVSQALLGMANSGDLLRKSLNLGNTALEENTALTEEAEKRYETTASKLQVLGNKANDAAITFGDAFLPAIGAVAEAVGDLLDGFSSLPSSMQNLIAWLGAVGGAAALAGGAFLLAIPKIAEFRIALGVLSASQMPAVAAAATGVQTAITRTTGAMTAAARFMTGPWGLAIAAAAVGVAVLESAIKSMQSSSEEYQSALANVSSADEIFQTAAKGREAGLYFGVLEDLRAIDETLVKIGDADANWWKRLPGVGYGSELGGARDSLRDIGAELGKLASTDGPAAARAFKLIADETDGSKEQLATLLNSMPEYRDALIAQAEAQGINVSDMTDAERIQKLLNIATEEATPPAESAAGAYKAAADEAAGLADEVLALVDAVNAANGVGQDAVSSNARYQASLAGIADEVQRQKDEYQAAHDTLDGFTLSLDESTASGSANASMLAGVAADAQTAAAAQYELDQKTMSAKDATDKYAGTLAEQRRKFEESATAAGFNADEVKRLADKVFALPSSREIEILAETAGAQWTIDNFLRANANKKINIATTWSGGQVPGAAAGGMIPGPPSNVDNRIYAMATGEFVTRASVVARPGVQEHLEYINRTGRIPVSGAYAMGGYVQPQYAQSSPQIRVPSGSLSLSGASITGTLEIGGDGLARIVDGRISLYDKEQSRAAAAGYAGGI
ncbi:phage tail tape measure protein [uncultured Microbacterium sp.]|uniref:phage tail tape measure protein n=1 Tax=uncultured Microbacterium sp. TaxID=191216 RepID=UPI00262B9F4A|nr:phage tail tape measure protein [uncultured Microbacterium sp.]